MQSEVTTANMTFGDLAEGWSCERLWSECCHPLNSTVHRGSFTSLRGFVVVVVPKEEALGFEGFGLVRRGFGEACSREHGSCYTTGEKLCSACRPLPASPFLFIILQSDTPTLMKDHVKTTLILQHTNTHTHPRSVKQMTFMWWLGLHSGDLTVELGYAELIVFHALFVEPKSVYICFVSAGVSWVKSVWDSCT